MNKVKAWIVKDGEGELILMTSSKKEHVAKAKWSRFANGRSWQTLEEMGFSCVQVEITEITNE